MEKYKFNCSDISYFLSQNFETIKELERYIKALQTREFNEAMVKGTAFHYYVQNLPLIGELENLEYCMGHIRVTIPYETANEARNFIDKTLIEKFNIGINSVLWEVPLCAQVAEVEGNQIYLSGRADGYYGNLIEIKTTSFFNIDSYLDNFQTISYLHLFNCKRIDYFVFVLNKEQRLVDKIHFYQTHSCIDIENITKPITHFYYFLKFHNLLNNFKYHSYGTNNS